MNRRKFIFLSSLTTATLPFLNIPQALSQTEAQETLAAGKSLCQIFENPENQHRLFVRWWWNGDRLTQKEILRELDVLKAAGIGGVEINPIKFPEQANDLGIPSLQWLSDEWIDMLHVALKGAKERGIICDMIVGSGWPYGGEFLTRAEQSQLMALGTKNLKGGQKHQISRKELLDSVEPHIHSPYNDKEKVLTTLKLVPANMNKLADAVDLSQNISKETIEVDVPAGDYVLYYLVKVTGFMAVIQGAPGANGPVLNHYNQKAVENYLDRMGKKLTAKIGPLGNYFRAFFTDSIELEGANWNDDLYQEFKKRNGYDLAPYFPFILFKIGEMGNAVNEKYGATFSEAMQQDIKRVRYDFETTRADLFKERFIHTFHKWCQKNGVKSRMQAYGRECHPIESSMEVDIPECETWLGSRPGQVFQNDDYRGGRAYTMINKYVSSGARFAGKKLISCEEITHVGPIFNTTLEEIKVAGDQSNLSGVTHSILHGFNYSPLEAPFPGWIRYGTFFNERNTWWPHFRKWADYKARLSALFQNAEMISNVAIMQPIADLWMTHGPQRDPFPALTFPKYQHQVWEAIHQNGSSADYISEAIIQKSVVKNGKLTFNTRSYDAIILLEVEAMLPDTTKAIQKFADAGGKVIFVGKEPVMSPTMPGAEAKNKAVAATFKTLKSKNAKNIGLVAAPQGEFINWYRNIQQQFNIKPHVTISNPDAFVSQLYYRAGDQDIFFITNYNLNKGYSLKTNFGITGKTPWLWNAETGKRQVFAASGQNLTIDLQPSESKLIVFDKEKTGPRYTQIAYNAAATQAIKSPWKITLNHVNGKTNTITLPELVDFKDRADLKTFAGVITYQNTITIAETSKGKYLDLGKLNGISEVSVNGRNLGTKWYGNHLYDISEAVKKGENEVSIKVTTTLGNYMTSEKENRAAQVWAANQPPQSTGLIGPVRYSG